MADDDERIRRKAYELWLADGCPEGRHEAHWEQAREIIALEDVGGPPTIPVEKTLEDPVEPTIAFENQGEFPGLTDQGEAPAGPEANQVVENADERPLSSDSATRKPRARKASADAPAKAAASKTASSKRSPATTNAVPQPAQESPAGPRRRKPRVNGAGADAG